MAEASIVHKWETKLAAILMGAGLQLRNTMRAENMHFQTTSKKNSKKTSGWELEMTLINDFAWFRDLPQDSSLQTFGANLQFDQQNHMVQKSFAEFVQLRKFRGSFSPEEQNLRSEDRVIYDWQFEIMQVPSLT